MVGMVISEACFLLRKESRSKTQSWFSIRYIRSRGNVTTFQERESWRSNPISDVAEILLPKLLK
jgi:hypothetical protein